jgi:branched-subunit amino acid aminotransferase/4-amino-4-deoxychorismate lyase
MSTVDVLPDRQAFLEAVEKARRPYHANYYAMYSTIWDGIVTNPLLMLVPVDDHMVHRGDGVFETFKCIDGNLYNMRDHLDRLERSAMALGLKPPRPREQIESIVRQTVRAGGQRNSYVRVFLSRGPGGFGVNRYESPACQLYVVAARMDPPFME